MSRSRSGSAGPLLLGVFFASGASALIFETLWFHQAGLALGNSIWATSLVLSGFMGGLCLGSAVAARFGGRAASPVRTYALLELAIGASGVALVYLLPSIGPALVPLVVNLSDLPWALNALRLVTAFLALLVPSTAMGLTLPLLARALSEGDSHFGSVLGRLYGWNTLGAVAGTLVVETHLVRILGIRGSAWVAGALNLAAALAALWISRGPLSAQAVPSGSRSSASLKGALRWLAACFLSGFVLLALEVIWFRFLCLFVLSQTLAFAVMLATVLFGIALGGLAASVWLRRSPQAGQWASPVALLLGAMTALAYLAFQVFAPRPSVSHALASGWGVLGLAVPLMLPVCILSGGFFTLVGTGLKDALEAPARAVGLLGLANTLGAALGAFAGGFLLLPTLGMESSFFTAAALYGGVAVLLPAGRGPSRGHSRVAFIVFALALIFFPFGTMENRYFAGIVNAWQAPGESCRLVGAREGLSETILYLEHGVFGRPLYHQLVTNSFAMSATHFKARRYMKLYVYLPAALHPRLKRALLISYGVGCTAKALTDTKDLERIDVVDISRDILSMAHLAYPSPQISPLEDPRVRVYVEDGRHYLQISRERFDLITGEPPPPNLAGVENLYSKEYFQLVHDHLEEGGMVTYWLPIHSLGDRGTLAVARAFLEVFDDATLWHGMGTSLMLVGTRNFHGPVPLERFDALWNDPVVRPELTALGLERPEQLGALFLGDSSYLRGLTEGIPPLVDDRPRRILERSGGGSAYPPLYLDWLASKDASIRFEKSPFIRSHWPESLRSATGGYFDAQQDLTYFTIPVQGRRRSPIPALHKLLTRTSLVWTPLFLLDSGPDLQRAARETGEEEQKLPEVQLQLGLMALAERRFADALAPLANAERSPALRAKALSLRLYALCMAGRVEEARVLAARASDALSEGPAATDYWEFMARTFGLSRQG